MDDALYKRWRAIKRGAYPASAAELRVEIGSLKDVSAAEKAAIIANCARFNMCIYRCRDNAADRASVRAFAAGFGLRNADLHLCANDDGVSELSVA